MNSGTQEPTVAPPREVADILASAENPYQVVVVDIREFELYEHSRIIGALNLSGQSNLDLSASTLQSLKARCNGLPPAMHRGNVDCRYILAYASGSSKIQETSCRLMLKKFSKQGWRGQPYIVQGGFERFAQEQPDWIMMRPPLHRLGEQRTTTPPTIVVEP
jgi:protein-tyrosine phosphatase